MTQQLPPPASGYDQYEAPKPSPPELSASPADKRLILYIGITFFVVIVVLVVITIFLFQYSSEAPTQTLADISIILLALVNIFIGFILIALTFVLTYLIIKLNDLVNLITRELGPLLKSANTMATDASDTVKTVQSRVVVVSDEAVKPVINALGTFAAAKAILRTLFGRRL